MNQRDAHPCLKFLKTFSSLCFVCLTCTATEWRCTEAAVPLSTCLQKFLPHPSGQWGTLYYLSVSRLLWDPLGPCLHMSVCSQPLLKDCPNNYSSTVPMGMTLRCNLSSKIPLWDQAAVASEGLWLRLSLCWDPVLPSSLGTQPWKHCLHNQHIS